MHTCWSLFHAIAAIRSVVTPLRQSIHHVVHVKCRDAACRQSWQPLVLFFCWNRWQLVVQKFGLVASSHAAVDWLRRRASQLPAVVALEEEEVERLVGQLRDAYGPAGAAGSGAAQALWSLPRLAMEHVWWRDVVRGLVDGGEEASAAGGGGISDCFAWQVLFGGPLSPAASPPHPCGPADPPPQHGGLPSPPHTCGLRLCGAACGLASYLWLCPASSTS